MESLSRGIAYGTIYGTITKLLKVIENRDTKNPYLRYSYQVSSYENGEFVVTLHYKSR